MPTLTSTDIAFIITVPVALIVAGYGLATDDTALIVSGAVALIVSSVRTIWAEWRGNKAV